MLARFAHVVARRKFTVIGIWVVLTIFGGFAAAKVSKRWYQSFSIPGKSAYETSQQTLKEFGVGVRPPNVVVFHSDGDLTKSDAVKAAMVRAEKANPGALTASYFSTGSDAYDVATSLQKSVPPENDAVPFRMATFPFPDESAARFPLVSSNL